MTSALQVLCLLYHVYILVWKFCLFASSWRLAVFLPSLADPSRLFSLQEVCKVISKEGVCDIMGIAQAGALFFSASPKTSAPFPHSFQYRRPQCQGCLSSVLLVDQLSASPIVVGHVLDLFQVTLSLYVSWWCRCSLDSEKGMTVTYRFCEDRSHSPRVPSYTCKVDPR